MVALPTRSLPSPPVVRQDRCVEPESLIGAVRNGDRAAFAVLYDAYSARVYGLALAVLRDPSHAEDVSQEVFITLWRRASDFDPGRGSLTHWILMIARSLAVDRVRSVESGRARDLRYLVGRRDPPDPDPVADTAIRTGEKAAVRAALSVLTPLQREVIMLAYYQGRTQQEISALLQVPLGTVKTRVRDALARLKTVWP